MNKRSFVMILISIVLIIGSVSLTVAVTPSPVLLSSDSHLMANQLAAAGTNVKILSVTYWHNGVKHKLDLLNPTITHDHSVNVITLSVKARYDGPTGTTGQLFIGTIGAPNYEEHYKLMKPGVTTVLTCPNSWSPAADTTIAIGVAGPDFDPWGPRVYVLLDKP